MAAAYIEDRNGVLLWNPDPAADETALWQGPSDSGYASGNGMLQWFHKGRCVSSYTGTMQAGKPHGTGRYEFADGESYEGDWLDGLRHGYGRHTFRDGRAWEGHWREDKRIE